MQDAPYIVEAERYGVDYPRTELEKRSDERRSEISAMIAEARDLVDQAWRCLDNTECSVWREKVETLMDDAERLSARLDDLYSEIR